MLELTIMLCYLISIVAIPNYFKGTKTTLVWLGDRGELTLVGYFLKSVYLLPYWVIELLYSKVVRPMFYNTNNDDVKLRHKSLPKKPLTDSEKERLYLVMEESSEVTRICSKILRYGYLNRNPLQEDSVINKVLLEQELGDLQNAINLMVDSGDVSNKAIKQYTELKANTISKWLTYN